MSARPDGGWDCAKGRPNKPRDVLDVPSVLAQCRLTGYTGESPDRRGKLMGLSTMRVLPSLQWGLGMLGAAKVAQCKEFGKRRKITQSPDGKVCGKGNGERE